MSMTREEFVTALLKLVKDYEDDNSDLYVEMTVGNMKDRIRYSYDGEKFVGPGGQIYEDVVLR